MSLTSITAASKLGNGNGYLYITDFTGANIVSSFENNLGGASQFKAQASSDIPLSTGTSAFMTITVSGISGSGTVTAVNVTRGAAASNQIGATINFTGATTNAGLATLIAAGINSHDPGGIAPDYTAIANGAVVTMIAPIGSEGNGDTVALLKTGTVTFASITAGGGFSVGNDSSNRRYYVDVTSAATASAFTASKEEMTSEVVPKSAQSGIPSQTISIVSDKVTYDRKGRMCYVRVTTEGGTATDDIINIEAVGMADGDMAVLMRSTAGQTLTVRSTGNLNLSGSPTDFVIDADNKSIWFTYRSSSDKWEEIFRTSVEDITDAGLRTAGISVGKSGSVTKTILAAGGTTTLLPGTDAKDVVWNGTGVTLLGSAVLTAGGSPINGDPFYIHYLPVSATGGNTVTIFGQVLSENQATQGVLAFAFYDTTASVWRARIAVDAAINYVENGKIPNSEIQAAKLANSGVSAGTYSLANLTVNAQGLVTSATSGVGSSGGILHSQVSDIATAANTSLTDLHTYTMPANTMITNGDMIKIYAYFTTAANANAKTLTVLFGSQSLGTIASALNNQTVHMTSILTRIGATNQIAVTTAFYATTGGGAVTTEFYDVDSSTENLANAVVIKTQGQNGVAAANDIVSKYLIVELNKR
mgnify:CR=1 FL=1|tara:strand:+ start:14072 stop:16009 length:1938 start_codon:yes stop_codon:yes gene_type:complete